MTKWWHKCHIYYVLSLAHGRDTLKRIYWFTDPPYSFRYNRQFYAFWIKIYDLRETFNDSDFDKVWLKKISSSDFWIDNCVISKQIAGISVKKFLSLWSAWSEIKIGINKYENLCYNHINAFPSNIFFF